MFLTIINPIGSVTSLDLHALPVWRLETRAISWPGSLHKALALGIAYPNAPSPGFVAIVAINCLVEGDEVEPIARIGLPGVDKAPMKERLREAMASLINSNVATKDVDEIKIAASSMIDCYHTLLQSLWGFNPPLATMGAEAKGELQGWRWTLLRSDRYGSWLTSTGDGIHQAPSAAVFEPPKPKAVTPVAAPSDPLVPADPMSADSLGIGPPPDENGPPRRKTNKKEST